MDADELSDKLVDGNPASEQFVDPAASLRLQLPGLQAQLPCVPVLDRKSVV